MRATAQTPPALGSAPLLSLLCLLAAITLAGASWMVFFYAPAELKMGFVQKIFYFHVPSAWMMMLSTPLMLVGAVGYLITRRDGWDWLSDAAIELSILFGALVLISGPLWGRKAWGVYWVWDVRLTATLVLILTLIACKIARGYAGPNAKMISAGLALLSVLNAGFVWISVDIWRGNHPKKLVFTLEPKMAMTLWVSVLGFHLAYACLLWLRLRNAKLKSRVDALYMAATEAGLDD